MTTTSVKTYKSTAAFRRDAPRMARQGYSVVSTHQEPSTNKPLRNLLKAPVGGTLLWGSSIKGGKIVVTYQALGQSPITAATMLPSAAAPTPPTPPAPGTLSPWAMLPVQPAPRGVFARYLGLVVWSLVCLALLGVALAAMAGLPH